MSKKINTDTDDVEEETCTEDEEVLAYMSGTCAGANYKGIFDQLDDLGFDRAIQGHIALQIYNQEKSINSAFDLSVMHMKLEFGKNPEYTDN